MSFLDYNHFNMESGRRKMVVVNDKVVVQVLELEAAIYGRCRMVRR